jgi:Tol biopolymer transport system component/predicted Ser/Thr protein kinase
MIGTTISHYRITDEIGRGGMGVVYKAEDTKLDRTVALKFFPPHALVTEDDRARFYREARAAAALHHPNIATVFEIDEVPLSREGGIPTQEGTFSGASSKTTPLIAMEYIEGETLTERVARGPLPVKEVISIASQAAEALKAAHAKSIVHRDVKSGNIMLTSDNHVKVLDFGLAKTASSTKLTQMGSTLGTVAYMSPEQARGEEVDHRSDLWSLGAVIYEMLTGRMPFPGDYEQAIVYGILNAEPEPPTALRTGVPMELEWIAGKLLTKDRQKRYQSADEVIVDLGRIDLSFSATPGTVIRPASVSMSQTVRASGRPKWVLPVGLLAALLVGALGTKILQRAALDTTPLHLQIAIPDEAGGAIAVTNFGPAIALSPDGRRLVFRGRTDGRARLFVQDFAAGDPPRPIDGTESARSPVFSPDGDAIVFVSGNMLKKVGLRGGAPQNVVPEGGEYPSFSWSGDFIVYVPSYGDGIYRISASGGTPELLAEPDIDRGEVGFTWPQLLPDGRHVLCASYGSGFKIVAIAIESGERKVLFEGGIAPTYLSSGHIVFAQKKSLLAAPFDVGSLEVGDPVIVVEDILSDFDTITSNYSVSASGSLAYVVGTTVWDRDLLEMRRDGSVRVVRTDRRGYNFISVSPDGKLLAGQALTGLDEADIWIVDLESGDTQLFESTPSWENIGPWLSDNSGLLFSSERRGSSDIYLKRFGDVDAPRPLVTNEYSKYVESVTADGRVAAYEEINPETGSDVWIVGTGNDQEPRPVLRSAATENEPALSPDGRYLAYSSDESGRMEVYVRSMDGPGRRVRISTDGGTSPFWTRAGQEILFQLGSSIMAVGVVEGGQTFTVPQTVFKNVDQWSATTDGRTVITRSADETPELHLILGWVDKVSAQVAAN